MTVFRVMTFNVNGAGERDGVNGWGNRASLNVATIKRYQPDLIGFQEAQAANLATYVADLEGYEHVRGHNYGDVEPTEWTSIFWKTSRFALVDSGQFWLSRTPDVPSVDWNVEYPMGATWVKLRCRASGTELLHLNTHLDDESELSRVEGSKLIAGRIADLQANKIPAVVTGDFNCNPWHSAYEVFMESGFTDTYRAAGHGDSVMSSTFHGLRGQAYFALEWGVELFWRVDWILIRHGAQRLQTTSCTIVRDAEPPLYPSDHYPVVSEMVLMG